MDEIAIKAEGLTKEYDTGFLKKKKRVLDNVSFEVRRGEIFGFIGHNGAGKTTTIKILLGLTKSTSGKVGIFGGSPREEGTRMRLGYLPENPYYYGHLTATEFMDLAGRLCGVPAAARKTRTVELLGLMGLSNVGGVLLSSFSKGMLQRIGIAQSLVNDPDLLIYDEPMSGLDPVGRREVRDKIIELKEKGKTIFFSTHLLSDAELICNSVGILINGRLKAMGRLEELLSPKIRSYEIVVRAEVVTMRKLIEKFSSARIRGDQALFTIKDEAEKRAILALIGTPGCELVSLVPRKERLEDIYMNELKAEESHG